MPSHDITHAVSVADAGGGGRPAGVGAAPHPEQGAPLSRVVVAVAETGVAHKTSGHAMA